MATTPAKPTVRRPWSVLGQSRRTRAGIHRRRRRISGRAAATSGAGAPPPSAGPAGSALGEGVADTTDGHDEGRRGRVVLDLVAKMADVDVDRLLVLVERFVVAEQLEE